MGKDPSNITWEEIENPEPYIGKKLSWDDIVKKFPDRWVALTDYKLTYGNTGGLEGGVLLTVCKDYEVDDLFAKYIHYKDTTGLCWTRTTELPGGALWIE